METLPGKCEEVEANLTSWEYAAGQITGSCGKGGHSKRQPRMETSVKASAVREKEELAC